ncbi:MAG: diaminopimelate epimerase [Micavibrio aeruginosavorus]|uniref:Diaminopimelate epimerase n=1 Tax=Micavibrio aeruginosavorus TaxID=349221 RepID=A0A2W5FQ83_9BACT|nr:MAG: diaminopimelate epimerase [Micavibrio aeruginosavorus]
MISFLKMQSLGNDFVVLDARKNDLGLNQAIIKNISDRRFGIGCDQLIVIEASSKANAFMRIYNPDGSEAGACGNATRCIADIILKEKDNKKIVLETISGLLKCIRVDDKTITVDMGEAKLGWDQIPLAHERDTLHLKISAGPFSDPVAVNMGNPHAVFFISDVEKQKIENFGPQLETHPLFPERANIEFVEVIDRSKVRMRVWERGAGITLACGSGACATAVAAIRRGLTKRKVNVIMDGGPLDIEWRESDGHVLMTGGFEYVFSGKYFISSQ